MGTVYALMAGIERYRDTRLSRLYGCRSDIADATAALAARTHGCADLQVRQLFDEEATRDALIDGFRNHLARATSDDIAVFWFSGHGSYARVPGELWHLEPDGHTMQTLVCSDSRVNGRPDLLDKELGLLLHEVADSGCHVLVVLDSCHSGGATRGDDLYGRDVHPRVARPTVLDTADQLLPELIGRYAAFPAGAPPLRHVTLSACRSFEAAMEQPLGGVPRGVFSWALSRALRSCPADTTYRDLLALTRSEMECLPAVQRPQLSPAGPGLGDQPILGGPAGTVRAALTMRWGRDGWQVDVGAAHGGEAGTRMTVIDRGVSRELRLTVVLRGHSLGDPIGWRPDRHRVYPVAVTGVPLAAMTVAVDRDAVAAVSGTLPYPVGVVGDAELTICLDHDGGLQLTDGDGAQIRRWPASSGAARIAYEVWHIVRWRQVWQLSNPSSRLDRQMSVELVEPLAGETILPRDRGSVLADTDGNIRLRFGRPYFVRLRNDGPAPVHCVLLTLTDAFAVTARHFRGATVGAHSVAAAAEGSPIEFRGTRAWLKVIVTTDDIDAASYELPPIGEVSRDLAPVISLPAQDWWTTTVPLIVEPPPLG